MTRENESAVMQNATTDEFRGFIYFVVQPRSYAQKALMADPAPKLLFDALTGVRKLRVCEMSTKAFATTQKSTYP